MNNNSAQFGQSIIIVGLARNLAHCIEKEIRRIEKLFRGFSQVDWVIVESDSDDNTLKILSELSRKIENFNVVSLGRLRDSIPHRVERIAICRNHYLSFIEERLKADAQTWVCIFDLDRLNLKLKKSSIENAIGSGIADVYFANQQGPYYDIFALRHKYFNPNDCFDVQKKLTDEGVDLHLATEMAVYSKMIRIPKASAPLDVDSAFGGFGIYRSTALTGLRYSHEIEGKLVCEHVPLNLALAARGYRLVIMPNLVNARYTEHTRHLRRSRYICTPVRSLTKNLLFWAVGESRSQKMYEKLLEFRR